MMVRTIFLFIWVLPWIFFHGEAAAQFEGVIEFRSWEPGRVGAGQRSVSVYATPDRLFLESAETYRPFSGMNTDGFLVRNDLNDFVIFSADDPVALKIAKGEVENFNRLAGYLQGSGNVVPGRRIEVTGRTDRIRDYDVEEVRVHEEEPGNYISVWLTSEIKINWGILQEMWHSTLAGLAPTNLPVQLFMNRNSFPLRIEYYQGGRQTALAEAVSVRAGRVERKKLEIPEGTSQIGFADLMMRMMRERR